MSEDLVYPENLGILREGDSVTMTVESEGQKAVLMFVREYGSLDGFIPAGSGDGAGINIWAKGGLMTDEMLEDLYQGAIESVEHQRDLPNVTTSIKWHRVKSLEE